jgi:hypothetical protein
VSALERFEGCLNNSQRSPLSAVRSSSVASRHCSLRTLSSASLSASEMWKRSSTRSALGQWSLMAYECLAHITAGPFNLLLLIIAQHLVEESVDGLASLSLPNPDDTGTLQVIDNGHVLVPLAVGDLIDAEGCQAANPMPACGSLVGRGAIRHRARQSDRPRRLVSNDPCVEIFYIRAWLGFWSKRNC